MMHWRLIGFCDVSGAKSAKSADTRQKKVGRAS